MILLGLSVVISIFTGMKKQCQCGNSFNTTPKRVEEGRGKFCSQACKYKYRVMPKRGIGSYVLVKENPTSFKQGENPWNKGTKGLMPTPPNFKGADVGYHALHDWVSRHRGKATTCEYCGSTHYVQWANKTHEYKRELGDWLELCRKCHVRYDRENNAWGLATRKFNLKTCRSKKR